jgi:murein DD-endopeptidase MepM/ murein hydrolase activator NlpD
MRPLLRRVLAAVVLIALLAATASGASAEPAPDARIDTAEDWIWPVPTGVRVVARYVAPAHAYGAGHRGVDLAATIGSDVIAPASGSVAFAGAVVDRPLLTIDHGAGLVTTLEPVRSDLAPGDHVSRGDVVGQVAWGGHAAADSVHFGVRLYGEYVNPLLLLEGVPRAILLPCC